MSGSDGTMGVMPEASTLVLKGSSPKPVNSLLGICDQFSATLSLQSGAKGLDLKR